MLQNTDQDKQLSQTKRPLKEKKKKKKNLICY